MRALVVAIADLMLAEPLAAQQAWVGGYETYAVVVPVTDEAMARPFAARHCGRYGRFAHFGYMDGPRAVFRCTMEKHEPPRIAPFSGRGIY